MKKLLLLALVGLTVLTGCPGPAPTENETPTTAKAGEVIMLGQTTSFLALATACSGAPISYTYSGTSAPEYLPSKDGSITSAGVFVAPVCGSSLLGSTVTITGACISGTIPHTAVASITVGSELVTAVTFVAADVNLCGAAVCRAAVPTSIKTPVCAAGSPTTIQYYVRIDATCGIPAYNPSDPALVSPTPPVCASTISP